MTDAEKLRELADILAQAISVAKGFLPHNYQSHFQYLAERAEELAQEDVE